MKDISTLNAFNREKIGSNGSKKVRQNEKIPLVILDSLRNC